MRPDDRKHLRQVLITAFKESATGLEQSLDRFKEFAMGHFSTEVTPEHFNGIQPRTIGGQIQQDQSACGATHHGFDFVVEMGVGIIPSDVDGARGMLIHERLQ